MATATDRHPGDAEAAAAIEGMVDLYGRRLPDRGEHVRGVTAGKRWAGECVHADQFRLIVEVDTEVFVTVPTSDRDIE